MRASNSAHAGLVEITLPLQLAPQAPDGTLGMGLSQKTQAGFHRSFLSARAAAPHGLGHQAIIDVDVRPHLNSSNVYKYHIYVYRTMPL